MPSHVPIINDKKIIRCKWCNGIIKTIKYPRLKRKTSDISITVTEYDYHEDCWVEAIEVQI